MYLRLEAEVCFDLGVSWVLAVVRFSFQNPLIWICIELRSQERPPLKNICTGFNVLPERLLQCYTEH